MTEHTIPPGFQDMLSFGFIETFLGRRSRRFFMGAEIPDGVFKYTSRHKAVPLTDLEKMLVVSACGGNTSWHHMIYRADRYAPHLSNYSGAAGGRVYPSAAGFHTSRTFFNDDDPCRSLTYMYCTRCHNRERICDSLGKKDEAAWQATIKLMGEYADIDQTNQDQVLICVSKMEKGESEVCKN